MSTQPNIEIRDLRQQDWIWTHKAVLFHGGIDGNSFKVYCGLAAYANNQTQEAFPSINTLAEKLNMARSTVMIAIGKLEKNGIIRVDRDKGEHNVYCLLSLGITGVVEFAGGGSATITPVETPRAKAERFFQGIEDLMEKKECEWLSAWLRDFAARYNVDKKVIWDEVRNFGMYWTEKNSTGMKERWQMEKTFEVERRLMTWFQRKHIQAKNNQLAKSKGRSIIKSTP